MIGFEDFKKMDLKVAEVLGVSDIEGKDKLYLIKIGLGSEERQIVAGLKEYYSKEALSGKKIIVVANIEPANIGGIKSEAMLLAVDVNNEPVLIHPDKDVPAGSKVI